jgi:NIMA (never in mitosis gene a)-related kinase
MDDSLLDSELAEEIGRGRFSKVDRVARRWDSQNVCVKRLYFSRPAVQSSKIRREIENWRQLDHPHIVKYIDSRETSEYADIVMEFFESVTLFEYNRTLSSRLTEQQCIAQFLQVASAVDYLHTKRLVHRDIKLENILINGSGLLKLCDFSFLECVDRVPGEFGGTLNCMAPEVLDEGDYSFPVDVWSLGCVFYEILTGRHPFPAHGTLRLMRLVKEEPTPPMDVEYSKDLQQLVYDMLAKEQSRRPTIGAVCERIRELKVDDRALATGQGSDRDLLKSVTGNDHDSGDVVRNAGRLLTPNPRWFWAVTVICAILSWLWVVS